MRDRFINVIASSLLRACLAALLTVVVARPAASQVTLDLLYDLRHTTDPAHNPDNFPSIEFKLFKALDFGSFLMKEEIDLDGPKGNASKIYTQLSQSIKLWSPATLLRLGYSGGLGLFNNGSGGFYLNNTYEVGAEHPFRWGPSFGTAFVSFRYTNAKKPSYDPMLGFYLGRGFFNYRISAATDVEMWTINRNHGDAGTETLSGKEFACLNEAELWFKIRDRISTGTFTRISYNVYVASHKWFVYPTVGFKYEF